MRFDHITQANSALEGQADHCEQMAKFYESEAAKMKTVAKTLREIASAEGVGTDPKIEIKPNSAFTLRRPAVVQNGVEGEQRAAS